MTLLNLWMFPFLQDNLLHPILGIGDPRKDKRIDFVGGIRGLNELSRRVDKGEAVAFSMFPTSIEQFNGNCRCRKSNASQIYLV